MKSFSIIAYKAIFVPRLFLLHKFENMRQIYKKSIVSYMEVFRVIHRMHEAGLIEKVISCHTSRKHTEIRLTPKGRKFAEEVDKLLSLMEALNGSNKPTDK